MISLYNFLDNNLYEIASHVKNSHSFEVNAVSFENADYLITGLFDLYFLRTKYFGISKDDYIFVNLNHEKLNLENLDIIFLRKLSEVTGFEFVSINSTKNYLDNQNKYIVLYYAFDLPQEVLRFLYSYNYLLSNRVIHIVYSQADTKIFEKKVKIILSDEFLENYVKNQFKIFNINTDLIPSTLDKIQGNISTLFRILPDILLSSKDKKAVDYSIGTSNSIHQYESTLRNHEDSSTAIGEMSDQSDSMLNVKMNLDFLTRREQDLYAILTQKKFISRDELVEIVWGKSKIGKISNNAIDQLISRMRKKFVNAGYSKNYIYSVKGKGLGIVSD